MRTTLVSATTIAAKGTVNTERTSFTIAANDQIIDADPFNDIVLAYRNGGPIRVRDVGQAIAAESDRTVAGYQNLQTRHSALHLQAAGRQRHRDRRQGQGDAAAPDGQYSALRST